MYRYLKLLFIFLVPLLIVTCSSSDDAGSTVATCSDGLACNNGEQGACTYADADHNCNGGCTAEVDCYGVCNGTAEEDNCGECEGDGSACATAFSFALTGSGSEFLTTTGSVDQDSDAAVEFKDDIAAATGADPSVSAGSYRCHCGAIHRSHGGHGIKWRGVCGIREATR